MWIFLKAWEARKGYAGRASWVEKNLIVFQAMTFRAVRGMGPACGREGHWLKVEERGPPPPVLLTGGDALKGMAFSFELISH